MEHFADSEAIKHGFGEQILTFSELIYKLQERFPEESYYQDYHKYYMTPDEVKKKMKQLNLYDQKLRSEGKVKSV